MASSDGEVIITIDGDDSAFKSALNGLKDVASKAAKGVAVAIGAGTAGLLAFGKSAVEVGMEFDSSMSQVAATMGYTVTEINTAGSEANETFTALRDAAKEAGATTAFSATEAADALNYMALAGYDSETAISMLPNVLNLAAAGSIDLATASDMVTDTQSALGLSLDETVELIDKMAKASSKSNTSVQQLGEAMLTVGGTAKNLKGGTTELSAALGILADNGVKGAEGGTALRNIILSLSAPTDKAAKSMQELGLTVFDSEGNMRGLNEIFTDLNESLGNMTQEQKINALNDIFNKVDLKSVNALLANSTDRFDELSEAINNAQGAAGNMAETQLDNLAGDITIMQSAMQSLQIAINDSVSPALREFVQIGTEGFSEIAEAIDAGDWDGAMDAMGNSLATLTNHIVEVLPQVIEMGAGIVVAFAEGIGANLGSMANAAMSLIEMFANALVSGLPTVLGAGAQILQNIAQGLRDNLPTLIPAALSMLTEISTGLRSGAGQLIDGTLSIIQAIGSGIISSLPALIESVPQIVTNIAGIINDNAPKLIETALSLIVQLAVGLVKAIPTLVKSIPEIIKAIVAAFLAFNWAGLGKSAFTALKNGIVAMKEGLASAANSILQKITSALASLPSKLLSLGRSGIQGLINGIRGLFGSIGTAALGIISKIATTLAALPSKLLELGKQAIQGLINGIKQKAGEVVGALTGVISNGISKVKKFLGIASPSKLMRDEVGVMMIEGVAKGVKKAKNTVIKAMERVTEDVAEAAEKLPDDFYKYVGESWVDSITKGLESKKEDSMAAFEKLVEDQFKAYKNKSGSLTGEYKTAADTLVDTYKDALNEGYKEAESLVKERLTAIATEYQSQYDDIIKKQDSLQDALSSDFGDLFAFKDDSVQLENIDHSIDQIQQYNDLLTQLREEYGATDAFLAEITSLGADKGLAAAKKLVGLGQEEFCAYQQKWLEKQQLAQEVAAAFYADQLNTLDSEFNEKLDDALANIPDELEEIGSNSMQGWIDGMNKKLPDLEAKARSIAGRVISAMRDEMDIHSPSKKTDKLVGVPAAQGVGVGFERAFPQVMSKLRSTVDVEIGKTSARLTGTANHGGAGGTVREITNNHTTVEKTVGVEATGSLAELIRLLRLEIIKEDKRVGKNMVTA